MIDQPSNSSIRLGMTTADVVAMTAKSILGAVPFGGALLSELAGSVIPNQRIDRLEKFAAELDIRLGPANRARVSDLLDDEEFVDLLEETVRQAARSTSDDRRRYLAAMLASGTQEQSIEHTDTKHLLRILAELTDIEVVWLRYHLNQSMDGDKDFRAMHATVLVPASASMDSDELEIAKATLQASYKEHLANLGLLQRRFRLDSKSGQPELDRRTGAPKTQNYEISSLGRLLLRQIDLAF